MLYSGPDPARFLGPIFSSALASSVLALGRQWLFIIANNDRLESDHDINLLRLEHSQWKKSNLVFFPDVPQLNAYRYVYLTSFSPSFLPVPWIFLPSESMQDMKYCLGASLQRWSSALLSFIANSGMQLGIFMLQRLVQRLLSMRRLPASRCQSKRYTLQLKTYTFQTSSVRELQVHDNTSQFRINFFIHEPQRAELWYII